MIFRYYIPLLIPITIHLIPTVFILSPVRFYDSLIMFALYTLWEILKVECMSEGVNRRLKLFFFLTKCSV